MKERGFTLIELLVGIMLAGLLATAVIGFFHTVIFTWERVREEKNTETSVFGLKFSEELGNILYFQINTKNEFKGDNKSLKFSIRDNNEIIKIEYFYDRALKTIIRRERKYEKTEEEIVIKNQRITDMNIYYFSKKYRYWKNEWDYKKEEEFPENVKIQLYFENGEKNEIVEKIYSGREY